MKPLGPGLTHNCTKCQAVKNLVSYVEGQGQHSADQVAAKLLKNKMNTEGIKPGEEFKLATEGKV